jgi:hypothetical protein
LWQAEQHAYKGGEGILDKTANQSTVEMKEQDNTWMKDIQVVYREQKNHCIILKQ